MRQLLVSLVVDSGDGKLLEKGRSNTYHKDFLHECLRMCLEHRPRLPTAQYESYSYDTAKCFHHHPEEDGTYLNIEGSVLSGWRYVRCAAYSHKNFSNSTV